MTIQPPAYEADRSSDSVLAFHDCELDRQRRELRRAGQTVPIEPKIFDLLVFMATQPDRALSKDELQAAAWPGLVVSDSVFSQAIMKARRAVGDDGQKQAVIATVHGYGYRFVAQVNTVENAAGDPASSVMDATQGSDDGQRETSATQPAPAATVRARDNRWPRRVLATVALPALALLILWLYARSVGGDDTGPVIAVLPSAQAVEDEYIGARNLMARALNSPGTLDVIPAERVTRLLAAHGVADDDDARIMQLLHDAMGVQYLLRTSIQQQGDQWTTHAVLIDREGRRTELAPEPGSMVAMVTGMGRQLSRTLGTRWRDQLSPSVMSHDDFANEAMARGLHALLAGDAGAAGALFESALSQDPNLLWARYELAQAQLGMNQPEQARQLLQDIRTQAAATDPRLAAHAITSLGIMDWRAGDMEQAESRFREAVAIYEEIGHDHGMASALGNLGILAENRGELDLADELYGQALIRFRRAHDLVGEAAVYTNTSILAKRRGRTTDAWRHQVRAVALQRRLGVGSMLVLSLTNQAELEHDLGHFQQARETLTEAGQLADANADPGGQAGVDLALARLRLDELDLAPAMELAAAARERYRELGRSPYEVRAGLLEVQAQLEAGHPQQADTTLQGLPVASATQPVQIQHGLLARQVAAVQGEPVDLLIAQIPELLADNDNPVLAALADATLAELHWQAGNAETAIGHWRDALRTLDGIDEPRQRARVQTRLAQALTDTGDHDGAELLLARIENWNPGFVPAQLQRLHLARARGDTAAAQHLANTLRQLSGATSNPLAAELAASQLPGPEKTAIR